MMHNATPETTGCNSCLTQIMEIRRAVRIHNIVCQKINPMVRSRYLLYAQRTRHVQGWGRCIYCLHGHYISILCHRIIFSAIKYVQRKVILQSAVSYQVRIKNNKVK